MTNIDYYKELHDIAERIENIRIALYTNKEHKKECTFEDNFQECDDFLFKIQSDLRYFVNDYFGVAMEEERSKYDR